MSKTDTLFAFSAFAFSALVAAAQPGIQGKDSPTFMGRTVTVTDPGTDADGFYPKGPASICIEGPPRRQCYTAPEGFGRVPGTRVIRLENDLSALLFSAASGGVSGSGWMVHFALLRPGSGTDLEDLFGSEVEVSSQSQYEFWSDPTISAAQIFVTADYVWGPDESHFSKHRYIVSAYVLKHPKEIDVPGYFLEDRYMTARSYGYEDEQLHVLAGERPEIIGRLRRLKAGGGR